MFLYYSLLLAYILKILIDFNIYYFFIASIIVFFLLKHLILPLFDIEISTALDALFSLENPEEVCYIVSCFTIEGKINIEATIKKLKERIFIHSYYQKLKKNVNTQYGITYWKTDPNFYLDDHIEVITTPYTDMDSFYNFMAQHANELRFPKNFPKWKFFILNNLPDNKSAIVLKVSHGMADGFSLMNFLMTIGDSKPYQLAHVPKTKNWQLIFIYIIGFFQILSLFKTMSLQKLDDNGFRRSPISKKKNGYCSSQLDFKPVKTYAKTLGVGINDVVLCLLSKALKNYHIKKFNEDLHEFSINYAANLVTSPNAKEIYPLRNNVTFLFEKLNFDNSNEIFQDCVKIHHSLFKKGKISYNI